MEKASTVKEPLCKQKIHRKVLDKGVPDDAMPGIKSLKVLSMQKTVISLTAGFLGIFAPRSTVRHAK